MIGVDDQDRIEAARQLRIGGRAEHRHDVAQPFVLHAAADRFDHQRLDVFGVDHAVRSDAPREPDREPAAAGAEVGDDRAVGDLQRIHDQIRLLPLVAVGRFEQAEILRRETARPFVAVCCGFWAGSAGGRGEARDRASSSRRDEGAGAARATREPLHDGPPSPVLPASLSAASSPDDAAARHRLDRQDLVEPCGVEQPALEHEIADRPAGL